MRRIVIFSLETINNVGDRILPEVTEFLVRRAHPDTDVRRVQLLPRHPECGFLRRVVAGVVRRLSTVTAGGVSYQLKDLSLRIRLAPGYQSALKDADGVICALGMFKFATQDFSHCFDLLSELCSRRRIPILFSAMSIARPDPNDWRCRRLAAVLRRPGVYITCRDGDDGVRRLQEGYGATAANRPCSVGDPALWIPECYRSGRLGASAGMKVGVNLVRGDIFGHYRGGVSSDRLKAFYGELFAELDRRGMDWAVFSNGIRSDERFGDEICRSFSVPDSRRIPPPSSVVEYIRTVSSFRVVFGARLHACLTATALGVPATWLDWDDKFSLTATALGRARYLVRADDLDAVRIADLLERASSDSPDVAAYAGLRAATAASIAEFVDKAEVRHVE